jgi:primosomal protein N' (replication factor Y)
LILWRAQAFSRDVVFDYLNRLAAAARAAGTTVAVHGPAAAAMERRGGRYRAHVLLQCATRAPLHALVNTLVPLARAWPEARKVRLAIDVDPVEL